MSKFNNRITAAIEEKRAEFEDNKRRAVDAKTHENAIMWLIVADMSKKELDRLIKAFENVKE